jgi:hypothetical protein
LSAFLTAALRQGNDQGNDRAVSPTPTDPWLPSDRDRTVVAPTAKPTIRRRGRVVGPAASDRESDGEASASLRALA